MAMVTIDELAASLGVVCDRGRVTLVDLDGVGEVGGDALDAVVVSLSRHPGLAVGVARDSLSPAGQRVAKELTTTVSRHDEGRVTVRVDDPEAAALDLVDRVGLRPQPAQVLGQVLRVAAPDAPSAVWVESLAYSTLLGGDAFRAWRASVPIRDRPPSQGAVRIERTGEVLRVVLNRPERRNALDAAARGALSDALDVAIADPRLLVELSGEGTVFCSGGDLDEFGTATDLALAHVLRVQRGPALRMLALGERTTAFVHGACVGAGVELAAFGRHVVAAPGSTFRLPEVAMGLIPGVGGTVSVTRRIGRWRAAWWMLTDAILPLDRAMAWGLVDDVA